MHFEEKGVFNRVENQVQLGELLQVYLGRRGRGKGEGISYLKIV